MSDSAAPAPAPATDPPNPFGDLPTTRQGVLDELANLAPQIAEADALLKALYGRRLDVWRRGRQLPDHSPLPEGDAAPVAPMTYKELGAAAGGLSEVVVINSLTPRSERKKAAAASGAGKAKRTRKAAAGKA